MGLEGLFARRAFRVATIEVDAAWPKASEPFNVSSADIFAWFAVQHGYDVFIKVPCEAIDRAHGSIDLSSSYRHASWIHPIAIVGQAFKPTNLNHATSQSARFAIKCASHLAFVIRLEVP
jgi:hypothetical protein